MGKEEKWFAVHTFSGYEDRCANYIMTAAPAQGLDDEILEVKIPTETVEEVDSKTSKTDEDGNIIRKTRERKIMPGYIFVKVAVSYVRSEYENEAGQWKMSERAWYVIRNTRGVTGFVGPAGVPYPLTEEEVENMGIEKRVIKLAYEVGDFVQINSESFMGMCGTVKSIDIENDLVIVAVSMLGRETPVEVGLDMVDKM
ncbi:MAG TPA: transcription termination/antitermination protein NusG [Clostridiales bacterium]|jgi:transcriptional antiterminator NusG|nr:transcription termination/antitermination protein NusG [Clostridiales bacterium]